ncbi:MAG: hypothetical protein NTW60_01455, partial [Candidatus Wolfebacteria bacterium]|nr:hypothetical protein [Candidatus Wolfebacteria bacterium]
AAAFVGPGSNNPPAGDPAFWQWQISGSNVYYTGGNVGIGTAAPARTLDVAGEGKFGGTTIGNLYLYNASNVLGAQIAGGGGDTYFSLNGGNVGIGTATPGFALTVAGGVSTQSQFVISGGNNRITNNQGDADINWTTSGSGADIYFRTNGAERMRIANGGNVGIGVTNPGTRLHVVGQDGIASALRVDGAANEWSTEYIGANVTSQSYGLDIAAGTNSTDWPLYVRSRSGTFFAGVRGDGNVGIGKTNPGTALDVNGTVTATQFVGGGAGLTGVANVTSLAGTWTGLNYFVGNCDTGSCNSPALMVYSTGGNGATMSFHRGGVYAVNFGLDSDNVLRIGGWSAAANRWQLDMSGNEYLAGVLYPGNIVTGAAQSTWYLSSHTTWGLYSNTSFDAQGLYDAGNRVYSAANPVVVSGSNFGGVYQTGGCGDDPVINPYTGDYSCPSGFSAYQIPCGVYICYR